MKAKPERVERTRVTGEGARFVWERRLRGDPTIPRHLKGFLLLIGTHMSANGRDARMSAKTLGVEWNDLSRQRVFELLQEAELLGWIDTEKRPGKPSERLPAIPNPSDTPDGYPSDQPDGSHEHPSDGSDPTRQTGLTHPSDGSDPTGTGQEQHNSGGTLPPDPLRPEHPSGTRNDHELSPSVDGPEQDHLAGNHQNARARENWACCTETECESYLDPDGTCPNGHPKAVSHA